MADFSPSYGKVFAELEGLGSTWEAAKVLRTRLKDVGALAVNKPEHNCEEALPDGTVCRSTDNARYNLEVLLPVFTLMKGHTDKVPELPALVTQLREAYKLVGRGNPTQKVLLDQAWSVRYLFGVVKGLLYKKTPPRACLRQDNIMLQMLRAYGVDCDNWVPVQRPTPPRAQTAAADAASSGAAPAGAVGGEPVRAGPGDGAVSAAPRPPAAKSSSGAMVGTNHGEPAAAAAAARAAPAAEGAAAAVKPAGKDLLSLAVPLQPPIKAEKLDTPAPAGDSPPADSRGNDMDTDDYLEILDKPSEEEIAAALKALPADSGPLEVALAAEADSLRDEAGEPERDLRKEQLEKKAKDKAEREQKKQEKDALKQQKQELKEAKAKERAQKKADKEEAAKQKEIAKNEAAAAAESSPAALEPDLTAEEPKGAKPKPQPKKRSRGTGNAPGRPRGGSKAKDADAQPKKRARRTVAAHPGADVNIAAELTQFMQVWQNKVYDKTRDTLHKKKGVNVYDKNRTAAGIKNPGSPQFAYFSRTYSGTCSIAVNVFLVRKFYEKWEDKALDAAWPFSDEGTTYFLMLVQTADLAHKNMQPAAAS
eukprot:s3699_g7.t1